MTALAEMLAGAASTAKCADAKVRATAVAIVFDCIMAARLGHTALEVRRLVEAQGPRAAGGAGASLLCAPATRTDPDSAAYANAVAMCWYELDPGWRHAGCHAPLHILPALLAHAEHRQRTVGEVIDAFIFCYDALVALVREWSLEGSGLHSHAVYSHLGAVLAVGAAADDDVCTTATTLDLASSAVNFGQFSEVAKGGELRNLWPALAALHAPRLRDAAVAGVATSSGRLERRFDEMFVRRPVPLPGPGDGGPAILGTYLKLMPCCRHLHTAVAAALDLSQRMRTAGIATTRIRSVGVVAHQAAAALSSPRSETMLNAQFSLPTTIAIALAAGAFDVESLGRRKDPDVRELAARVRVVRVHDDPFPRDRGARIDLEFVGAEPMSARIDVAPGDPGPDADLPALARRKAELICSAMPPGLRDDSRGRAQALWSRLDQPELTVGEALSVLAA